MRQTRQEIYRKLRPEMVGLGFSKMARQEQYNLALGDDVRGFCVFSAATKKTSTHVWIAVAAGLVFSRIEQLISAWCGDSLEQLSTVHTNIGYLSGQGRWFEVAFTVGDPVDDGVADLVRAVRSAAIPFLEAHSDATAVARLLEHGIPMSPLAVEERLPLAYALAGNLDKAYEALDRIADKVESGDNPYRLPRRLAYLDGFRSTYPR